MYVTHLVIYFVTTAFLSFKKKTGYNIKPLKKEEELDEKKYMYTTYIYIYTHTHIFTSTFYNDI